MLYIRHMDIDILFKIERVYLNSAINKTWAMPRESIEKGEHIQIQNSTLARNKPLIREKSQ